MRLEKTALFIDGSNFYAATRLLNMDVDYAKLHAHFSQNANLIRAYYYTALPEDQEFSPLRPLIDWLDYNGFAVVSKLTREFTDPETGKKTHQGQYGYGTCPRYVETGTTYRSRHFVFG